MRLEHYKIYTGDDSYAYEFTSIGNKGSFRKIVVFQNNGTNNVYNLAFGDKNEITNELDDGVVTNNGDTATVLATISAIIYLFTDNHPNALIYFEGSTPSRTRLYKIGIDKYIGVLLADYDIYGETVAGWESFSRNQQYKAFLVKRKKL